MWHSCYRLLSQVWLPTLVILPQVFPPFLNLLLPVLPTVWRVGGKMGTNTSQKQIMKKRKENKVLTFNNNWLSMPFSRVAGTKPSLSTRRSVKGLHHCWFNLKPSLHCENPAYCHGCWFVSQFVCVRAQYNTLSQAGVYPPVHPSCPSFKQLGEKPLLSSYWGQKKTLRKMVFIWHFSDLERGTRKEGGE